MWQCNKVDSSGERCMANAVHRLHFAKDHPFDHFDLCDKHLSEYTDYLWLQEIEELELIQDQYLHPRRKT